MPIDLRSDTVTRPTPAMREAMARADVGDDVYGEDPTVNALQRKVADLLGKEDALFVPTGVMANQIAIKLHTQPSDEILVEAESHIFHYETAAPSFLSSVQVRTVPGTRGVMRPEHIEERIRTSEYYLPRTALVCLENTHNRAGGTIYPLAEIAKVRSMLEPRGIPMHLDGARLWNAWMASGVHAREYASHFETVAVCFSKGLGAPIGSALAGPRELMQQARKFRKIVGGGMRQVGVIAAAAVHALDHHIDRLKEDHQKAKVLAETLAQSGSLGIDLESVQSNMVMIDLDRTGFDAETMLHSLREHGVLLTREGRYRIRAVTHLDVSLDQTVQAAEILLKLTKGKK